MLKEERFFSRELKVLAVQRVLAGEPVKSVCDDLRLRTQVVYKWRAQFLRGGAGLLREWGRPHTTMPADDLPPSIVADDLSSARRRIEELERKIGQQQVELDFFQQVLRHVRAKRRSNDATGVMASTKSSKR